MTILITGFEPFGGEIVNPSSEILKRVSNIINDIEIIKLEVPVVYHKSIDVVIKKIEEIKPKAVLMIGQAGGRFDISVERVAINIDDKDIPDNEGNIVQDSCIDLLGLPAYFATIPIKTIVSNLKNAYIPSSISNTADTYVCNHLMYGVLNYIYKNKLSTKGGFIHIPFMTEQVVNRRNTPALDLDTMAKAIEIAIDTVICSL